ncbi:hypothetical protein [Bradyrhizobium betae]|uniref:hypothetical protein n=1 Tax=Bradyrhizobium betae TaxID=244734 RepID=UPI0012B6953D|nr:hypothetical protein [Bradyrhizobium betae]MCS3726522.1 hypothetical protein [Bradyrhizobium betae]
MAAPLIVSIARNEIIAKNFMAGRSVPIVTKNVRERRDFRKIQGTIMTIHIGFHGVFQQTGPNDTCCRASAGFTVIGR